MMVTQSTLMFLDYIQFGLKYLKQQFGVRNKSRSLFVLSASWRPHQLCHVSHDYIQDTGKLPVGDHPGGTYDGPPIHTLTIFANPFVQDPPSPTGEGVQTVEPGQIE